MEARRLRMANKPMFVVPNHLVEQWRDSILQLYPAAKVLTTTKDDFKNGTLPAPFATGLGALDGLDFAGMVRLDTEIKNTNSVTVTPPFGKPMMLTYDQDIKLAGPADIAIRKQADGSYLLVIPELSATSPNKKDNPVTVIRLPANFDQF